MFVWPNKFLWINQSYIVLYTTNRQLFLKKTILWLLCVGTATAPCGIVICPVRTNKTSNSIPSVIKGYLDRNINISLKLNQMLLHGGVQDSEEGEKKTEKQGRHFTQESESVPRPQHFIPEFLHPPSPWPLPPNPEQGDIPEETGEKSHPVWIWFSHEALRGLSKRRLSHCTHRREGLTTARMPGWLLEPDPPPPYPSVRGKLSSSL